MFHCTHCDAQSGKWQGRCGQCGQWGTLVEEDAPVNNIANLLNAKPSAPAAVLDLSKAGDIEAKHQATGIGELDRVLGGGLVPGSVVLLAGEPGIGKSTLTAQLGGSWGSGESRESGAKVLYVSGEESQGQILGRFKRLKIDPKEVLFSSATEVQSIVALARKTSPRLLIVDSVQTLLVNGVDSLPGSPTAVRASATLLISYAKESGVPVLLIGQVTKDGNVAGPKTLEHLVDVMLTLEGDADGQYRLLHASKNRFGSIDEVGIFEMTEGGMIAVDNPSSRFLSERTGTAGSAVACLLEGTRPVLLEIQALTEKSIFPNPIRRTSGFDTGRLQMLLAIIGRRAGISVSGHDVYVNVVGGLKVREHAADLAVCAAVISSVTDKPLPQTTVYVGEVGLGGELRTVPRLEARIKEANRLGFDNVVSPKSIKHLREIASLRSQ